MIVLARHRPVQSPWSEREKMHLIFHRWLVVQGRLTDGESEREMLTERKFCHRFAPAIRTWTRATVDAFEARRG